jgi:hypothetical protein
MSPINSSSTTTVSGHSTSSQMTSSSSKSTSSTRPDLARQSSYTHTFPSTSSSSLTTTSTTTSSSYPDQKQHQGLSKSTTLLAKQLFHPDKSRPSCYDNPSLFCNGLQWLLESTSEPHILAKTTGSSSRRSVMPLTEDAVRRLDRHARHDNRIREMRQSGAGAGAGAGSRTVESLAGSSVVDRSSIDAWVSQTTAS